MNRNYDTPCAPKVRILIVHDNFRVLHPPGELIRCAYTRVTTANCEPLVIEYLSEDMR